MNDFDDELRSALGGSGPPAPTPPPFDDVRRRARAQQRRQRSLVGSGMAVVLVVAGVVTWSLATGDDDPDTNVVTEQPDGSGDPSTTTVPVDVPPTGPRPGEVVAVDEHGRLVVVDAATGAVIRQLDSGGDPTQPLGENEELGPNLIGDVALGADGLVYYTSVGEPASGSVHRIPVDGSQPPDDEGPPGNDVAISPEGDEVASATGISVEATPPGPPYDDGRTLVTSDDGNTLFGALSWSLDGSTVAVEAVTFDGDGARQTQRILFRSADGGTFDGPPFARADEPTVREYARPAFRADGAVVVAEQDRDAGAGPLARVLDPSNGEILASFEYGTDSAVVDQSYDATGTWLLVTFEDGTMRWYGGGESGVVPGSYRAGDW